MFKTPLFIEGWAIALIIVGVAIFLIVLIVVIWFISTMNSLRRLNVKVDEAESGIDVALTKRYDLLTKEVAIVKGVAKHEKERAGNRCPHCSAEIPPMTKICPECGRAITGNESEGDKELLQLIDDLENALKKLKTCGTDTYNSALADIDRLVRKANTFYGENKKVRMLIFDIEEEKKIVQEHIQIEQEKLREKSAHQAIEKFQKKLEELENVKTEWNFLLETKIDYYNKTAAPIKNYIETFPIPMIKEDLLSFIVYLQSKANSAGPKDCIVKKIKVPESFDYSYAYWILYCHCIDTAKFKYNNDPDFVPYITDRIKAEKKGNIVRMRKKITYFCVIVGSLVAFIILYYYIIRGAENFTFKLISLFKN